MPEPFPSQAHKLRESREVEPITREPGRVRKAPAGRRFMDTIFLGDFKSMWASMIWDTFFPNLRDNFADSVHDGIDNLFGGGGGRRGPRRGFAQSRNSQISKHNPDQALGGNGSRLSREDRDNQRTDLVEIDSRAEAEEVLDAMLKRIDQYDVVTLAEFYQMCRMSPQHTDYSFGWEELGNAKVAHSRGVYYLDLPPVIRIK